MNKKNVKFDQIITTARKLFWKHGIKRITVKEICEEAEVSKMTFYKYFKNKNDLAKYIIHKIFDEGIQQYRNIIEGKESYINKVKKIIIMKMEFTNDISQEFLNDIYKSGEPEIQHMIRQFLQRNINMIRDDFIEAQKKGNIRKNIKPEFLVYMMNKMVEISTDEQLNKLYANPQEMIHEFVNFFYYGIIPADENSGKIH